MLPMHRPVVSAILALAFASAAFAQGAPSEEPAIGLNAGVSFGMVAVSFDEADAVRHSSYRLEAGVKLPAWRHGWLRQLHLTPKLGLHATHIGGMDPDEDTYAYSSVDLAVRASYARWRLRPFVEFRKGVTQTGERLSGGGRILNFKGAGKGVGAGIQVPISPTGRGVELGISVLDGAFDSYEFEAAVFPAQLRHRAVAFHVGWSGLFTGISLPWQ
jgi:hypothetical protein